PGTKKLLRSREVAFDERTMYYKTKIVSDAYNIVKLNTTINITSPNANKSNPNGEPKPPTPPATQQTNPKDPANARRTRNSPSKTRTCKLTTRSVYTQYQHSLQQGGHCCCLRRR